MAKHTVNVDLWYNDQWNDQPGAVLVRDGITITRGRQDESGQPAPSTATLSFNSWDYNPRNPTSSLSGLIGRNTGLRIRVNGTIRFVGEVSSWTPRQSLGGSNVDRWVQVQAADITRRLGQGADPLQDAVYRYMTVGGGATNLVGFWPMASGGVRDRAAVVADPMQMPNTNEVSADQRDMRLASAPLEPWTSLGTVVEGTVPAQTGLLPGQSTVAAKLDSGEVTRLTIETAYRYISGNLENRAGHQVKLLCTGSDFRMDWFTNNFNVDEEPPTSETLPRWRFTMRLGTIAGLDEYERIDLEDHNELVDGLMHVIRVDLAIDAGANELDWTVYFDAKVLDSGTVTSFTLNTFRAEQVNLETRTVNVDKIVYGPVAVWAGTPPDVAESLAAHRGHVGEHAGDRLDRLADEENILFSVDEGSAGDTVPCGPQYPDPLLAVMRQAADVDRGFLLGHRIVRGALEYVTGRSLSNQDATLGLDYAQAQVAPPLEPTTDDQATRNDVTVTRRDGGQARAVDTDGPLGVDTVGRVTTQETRNCLSDADTGNQAGWLLHLGTVDEVRLPQITVDLDATPGLETDAEAADVGRRITIDNLPGTLSPDLASLVVQGYTETVFSHRRKITFNCTPEEPYHIAEVEHADYGVLGSSSATLDEALDTTETGVDIDAGAGPDWTHEADFDVLIGGERMTVTAVGAMSGTFPARKATLTVTRSVNGVVKTHATGAAVRLFHQSYIGL